MESGFRFKVAMVLKFQLSFEVTVSMSNLSKLSTHRETVYLLLGYQLDFNTLGLKYTREANPRLTTISFASIYSKNVVMLLVGGLVQEFLSFFHFTLSLYWKHKEILNSFIC